MRPQVLLQAFYKRGKFVAVPCPADPHDAPVADWWWDHLAKNATEFAQAGFTSVWLPPITKAEQGSEAAALGYSVFDDYDIGAKDQKGSVHTRYGTREQVTRLAAMLRANGLDLFLDLQLNHRKGGDGPDEKTFQYRDAFGDGSGGRFPKERRSFHSRYPAGAVPATFQPEIPQDPAVPDGIGELQIGSKVYFGPDLAPINAQPAGYVSEGLITSVEWLTRALDAQGYRLDHVQGVSAVFLRLLLSHGIMQGKFAVGEFWDGDIGKVNDWTSSQHWMAGRCSAFDFPLYFKLLAMSNDPSFNMAELDHAGLAGVDPLHAVTFVENHDTESRRDLVPRNIQPDDKPLAYAYILTSEGLPCVFYKDFSTAPGCLGDLLQPVLLNLLWIHQNVAVGQTEQRWKSADAFVFERTGGSRLLVGLNKNKAIPQRLSKVATGFGSNQTLHDYTGHAPDLVTDSEGRVDLIIPRNGSGSGYVCYSLPGLQGQFTLTPQDTTQVFEGAADLDIKPALAGQTIRIARIYCEAGTSIHGRLNFDDHNWTPATSLALRLLDPAGVAIGNKTFRQADQGGIMTASSAATGFHTWTIQAIDARPNFRSSYALTATYRAPRTL
jgi:alpha-amylase